MNEFPVVEGVTVLIAPPDGYLVDFDNPQRRDVLAAYVVCGIGSLLSLAFFTQYLYVKLWLLRKLDGETICLGVGWIFSVAIQVTLIRSYAMARMGVHAWEISLEDLNYASKASLLSLTNFVGYRFMVMSPILYAVETGVTKVSLILFYLKLSPQKWWKWSVYGTFFFVAGYNVAIFFAVLFGCHPIPKYWTLQMKEGSCVNRPALYIATAALGISSDLILLLLPMPMIVRLQMPSRQKAGLVLLFTIGSATLVTSVVRLVLLVSTLHDPDSTWAMSSAAIWIFVEANLLIMCASLTTLRRFFIHVAPKLIGERGSSAGYHLSGSAGGYRHPFKTIGSVAQRKKVDKFGMTAEDGVGFDLGTIGHATPTLTAVGKGGEKPERVIARHLRKQESINKFAESGSEVQIWDPQFSSDDVDAERAILQTTTVTVKYHCKKTGKGIDDDTKGVDDE
ncbi:hypothetical protein B0J13DRAFT_608564 [Dactylonectria estremocensis]|uniref:Rhodopsin domain-containing protein n=1 Tax=Dactylonectria estremocensis TaxID=1079267 RepID=A0A9P9J1R3_9HYPO|nr:hypothetical protein B0J13DRAFT_608564 [Dactylonectria estremocensis]